MAHTKAAGSTKLGRDSQPQYLGVKLYNGEPAKPGSIIVRQRGTKIIAGQNVRRGKDDTLYAVANGIIKFTQRTKMNFNGTRHMVKVANVVAK